MGSGGDEFPLKAAVPEVQRKERQRHNSRGMALPSRDFSVILDITAKVRPDKEFRAEVERICGPEVLEVLAN